MAGIDGYTKLMLHCDGEDGSQIFIDSSLVPKIVTVYGNAQIDTAQYKFGGASVLFDGSGDYLSTPDSPDFDFDGDTGAFTIDARIRLATVSLNYQAIVTKGGSQSYGFYIKYNQLHFQFYREGWRTHTSSSANLEINTWYHVVIVFDITNNSIKMYKDGIEVYSASETNDPIPDTTALLIGFDTGAVYFDGWIDELRVSKGIARWTENFTPPTSPYTCPGFIEGYIKLNNVGVGNAVVRIICQDTESYIGDTLTESGGYFEFLGLDNTKKYHLIVEYIDGEDKYNSKSLWDIVPIEEE